MFSLYLPPIKEAPAVLLRESYREGDKVKKRTLANLSTLPDEVVDNRDKKKGKTQIVFGLLCDQNGCPIAVEVFEGNTSDTSTF
ncbi:MAG: hypothetical protein QNJ42_08525, partial [Crocosphaera sp.]|nr:hypothetical protein [Crocosphaera sp.]